MQFGAASQHPPPAAPAVQDEPSHAAPPGTHSPSAQPEPGQQSNESTHAPPSGTHAARQCFVPPGVLAPQNGDAAQHGEPTLPKCPVPSHEAPEQLGGLHTPFSQVRPEQQSPSSIHPLFASKHPVLHVVTVSVLRSSVPHFGEPAQHPPPPSPAPHLSPSQLAFGSVHIPCIHSSPAQQVSPAVHVVTEHCGPCPSVFVPPSEALASALTAAGGAPPEPPLFAHAAPTSAIAHATPRSADRIRLMPGP